jgi:hypothetical protein
MNAPIVIANVDENASSKISSRKDSKRMPLAMTRLLIHSQAVPEGVREALAIAEAAPPERRHAELAAAARLLHAETALDCRDVRELVGISAC